MIVGIILYMNNLFEGKNLILNSLSQGEVLAGIAIALPTLVTWNQAIEQSKENKKNTVSDNVRAVSYTHLDVYKRQLYIFPKIDRNMYRIDDDEQFVLDFLKQEKVLLVHGRGFNWQEPDHFRIVYLPRVDELAQIQEKMTRFLKQYRR